MIIRLITALLFIGVLSAPFWLAAQQQTRSSKLQEIAFERLKTEDIERQARGTGWYEGAVHAQQRVFTDSESWQKFWAQYNNRAPKVDFTTHQVAAIFLGPMPHLGYKVEINKITYLNLQ